MKKHWDNTSEHTANGHSSLVKFSKSILVTHWRADFWENPELLLPVKLKGAREKGYMSVYYFLGNLPIHSVTLSHRSICLGIAWSAKSRFCLMGVWRRPWMMLKNGTFSIYSTFHFNKCILISSAVFLRLSTIMRSSSISSACKLFKLRVAFFWLFVQFLVQLSLCLG